jgi:hypothetical protein
MRVRRSGLCSSGSCSGFVGLVFAGNLPIGSAFPGTIFMLVGVAVHIAGAAAIVRALT